MAEYFEITPLDRAIERIDLGIIYWLKSHSPATLADVRAEFPALTEASALGALERCVECGIETDGDRWWDPNNLKDARGREPGKGRK